ncbi:MAG TPA: DnaD domain protein [Dehalococcoidia bacterium]|nr:DnaD domain protein [Dehalococcoidia bacterium]
MRALRTTPLLTPNGRAFAGFPSSGLATALPNLLFARVLPEITRPEELVVTVYFFYAQQQAPGPRRTPRFLTRRELAADATLLRSLANLAGGTDHETLARGLDAALERNTLFRAEIEVDGGVEEVFAVNTPSNRRAMEALTGTSMALDEPLPPAEGSAAPNIFALYEENIGTITPLIAEHLQDAEDRYSAEWIREAFREAVSLNKRNWRYIATILRRWETEGPDYEKPGRDAQIEWLEERYRAGQRKRRSRS